MNGPHAGSPIEGTIKQMLEDDIPVFIFGCGDLGKYSKRVFEFYGIDIRGYISNNLPESGIFEGKTVRYPAEIIAEYPDNYVAVCIFSDETEQRIVRQLEEIGYRNFIKKELLITSYLSLGLKPISMSLKENEGIAVKAFTLCITEYCSLRCKYCGEFIPYIKDPVHYPIDECVRPIERMAQVVEEINEVAVIGGEPFVHPKLAEICEGIARIDKVKKITLTGNGTVVPSEMFFEKLASFHEKIRIFISDYGKYTDKFEELKESCEKWGIRCEKRLTNEVWEKASVPEKKDRSLIENRNLYATCNSCAVCSFMIQGRLYKCMAAGIGERLGIIPYEQRDSVDFSDMSVSLKELKQKFIRYMTATKPLIACDYCEPGERMKIEKAEQIHEADWDLEKLRENF